MLITVALIEGKLKVNVIPTRAKDSEDQALNTPLSYTGSPEDWMRNWANIWPVTGGFTRAR